jgi:hypothetical protein
MTQSLRRSSRLGSKQRRLLTWQKQERRSYQDSREYIITRGDRGRKQQEEPNGTCTDLNIYLLYGYLLNSSSLQGATLQDSLLVSPVFLPSHAVGLALHGGSRPNRLVLVIQRLKYRMLLPQDVSLDEPRDPGSGLILDESTSRYREDLVQLFQGELLGLSHE